MNLTEALETLKLHAQDYAAPRDLRDAVDAVTNYFEDRATFAPRPFEMTAEASELARLLKEAKACEREMMRDRMNQRDQDDHP